MVMYPSPCGPVVVTFSTAVVASVGTPPRPATLSCVSDPAGRAPICQKFASTVVGSPARDSMRRFGTRGT